ncbi:hypothetical protein F5B22DRAFT_598269 [Xylaria bambusicola]|uniref:uncharacterized protein n=1 Tax=Xylaria bambusicola TaxID=326684 RepID=UPI002008C500|nr:uncharacterized protein F5B22DRAFT_598269 [Xylaria bambusicola]KAI0520767.1 hypothetical protein F5B22DRAFT_598269 [Xylaria bambusicola]
MRATSFAVLATAAATLASAAPTCQTPQTATVVVETAHGGAFNDRTNVTISVPVGPVYVNGDALAAVSTLYLLGPDTVTCSPFKAQDGTVNGGLPFTVGQPSLLSTNSVVVGSLVCTPLTPA